MPLWHFDRQESTFGWIPRCHGQVVRMRTPWQNGSVGCGCGPLLGVPPTAWLIWPLPVTDLGDVTEW